MTDEDILGGPMANKMYPDIMHAYMDMIIAGLSAGISHVGTLQISDATGKQVSFGSFVPGIPEIGHRLQDASTATGTTWATTRLPGHQPQAHRRQVVHGRVRRLHQEAAGDHRTGRHHAGQQPGGLGQPHGRRRQPRHPEDPWVTAGKAGGALKTGLCVGEGRSTADAIDEFSRAFGAMPADKVTGAFPELKV